MELYKALNGTHLTIAVNGRLENNTAPQLSAEVAAIGPEITMVTLNLKDLQYISSAGLRSILQLQKKMNNQGSMEVINAIPIIMDVFEVTGFASMLNFG